MELSAYLAVARRWWWTLLAATVVAGTVGYFAARTIPPTYEAEAKLLIGPVSNTDLDTIRAASSLAETYGELAHSDSALLRMSQAVGLSMPLIDLRQDVKVVADDVTRLISIRAEAGSPELAARMANQLASQLQELQTQGPTRAEGEIHVIDQASPPPEPIAPSVNLIAVMAAGAGLVASLLLVLIVEHFSDTVSGRFELADFEQVPFLGSVALPRRFAATPANPLAVEAIPESRTAVTTRLVASKISFARGTPLRSVLIIGAEIGDRAPELAANVAAALAASGRKVVLVDANDIEGQVTGMFSIDERTGVRELLEWPALQQAEGLLDAVLLYGEPGLDVLPHGAAGPQLIDRESAQQLMQVLGERFDIVVVNAAPIHRSGSSLVWARVTEATVLVAHRDQTKRRNLAYALDSLRQVSASVIGTVLLERRWTPFAQNERPRKRDERRAAAERRQPQPDGVIRALNEQLITATSAAGGRAATLPSATPTASPTPSAPGSGASGSSTSASSADGSSTAPAGASASAPSGSPPSASAPSATAQSGSPTPGDGAAPRTGAALTADSAGADAKSGTSKQRRGPQGR